MNKSTDISEEKPRHHDPEIRHASIIFANMKRQLKTQGLMDDAEIDQKERIIHTRIKIDIGFVDLFLQCDIERGQVVISAVTPLIIRADLRDRYLEAFNKDNPHIYLGFFYLDEEGRVIFRTSFFYREYKNLNEMTFGLHLMGAIATVEACLPSKSETADHCGTQ